MENFNTDTEHLWTAVHTPGRPRRASAQTTVAGPGWGPYAPAVRVVAGKLGGRRLTGPRGETPRPTADRVREALFNVVGDLEGAHVLDLFSGTGAVGIEAWSRGATRVVLVERAVPSLRILRRNLSALGLSEGIEVKSLEVARALPGLLAERAAGARPFDLIFADPPYAEAEAALAPVLSAAPALLADDGVLVLEHARRTASPSPPEGMDADRPRHYGDTTLTVLRKGNPS